MFRSRPSRISSISGLCSPSRVEWSTYSERVLVEMVSTYSVSLRIRAILTPASSWSRIRTPEMTASFSLASILHCSASSSRAILSLTERSLRRSMGQTCLSDRLI